LIYAVRDRVTSEKSGELIIMDEGVSDKRLLAIESEFAGPLKTINREGNILSITIRQAWNGRDRVSELIKERGDANYSTCRLIRRTSIPSRRLSPRSRDSCEKLRLGPEKRWWRRWVRRSRRSQHKTPVVSSSTPATVCRSNRCDHRCTLAQLTSPPLTFS